MPVTLEEAKRNAQTDLDVAVIDEFRKTNEILDTLIFDDAINPSGGGATLTYGYRRLKTQATAAPRKINTEYTPQNVETSTHTVDLVPLGGSFEVDRVIARVGSAASNTVTVNMRQKIKATRAVFTEMLLTGDTAKVADGFDGLDKALTGSSTELGVDTVTDWRDVNDNKAHGVLDKIDELLALLDEAPTAIVANRYVIAKLKAAARRANQYTDAPVDGLVDHLGKPVVRGMFGNILLIDAGEKAGSGELILPNRTASVGSEGSVSGLSDLYVYRVGLDGFHGVSTVGGPGILSLLPDFTTAGAVKKGEVELGPVAVALKASKAAAVLRNIRTV